MKKDCAIAVAFGGKMSEIWKDIKGYEGFYQVSSEGRVKRVKRSFKCSTVYGGNATLKELILKPRYDSKAKGLKHGYFRVSLKGKSFCVHRLVAEAFIPNPDNKPYVDHIDTDIENNKASNLRWVTASENNRNILSRKKRSILLNGDIARDVAKSIGVSREAFQARLRYGWSIQDACTIPLHKRKETA